MSEIKHTPAPWDADWGDGITGPRVGPSAYWDDQPHIIAVPIRSDRDGVAWVVYSLGPGEDKKRVLAQLMADARLIAAAPELLEALKELLPDGWDGGTMDHMPGVFLARAAIAKAEGRTTAR